MLIWDHSPKSSKISKISKNASLGDTQVINLEEGSEPQVAAPAIRVRHENWLVHGNHTR